MTLNHNALWLDLLTVLARIEQVADPETDKALRNLLIRRMKTSDTPRLKAHLEAVDTLIHTQALEVNE